MKKTEFKENLYHLLDINIEDMSFDEKIFFIKNCLIDYLVKADESRITKNRGGTWRDEEIALILSYPATKENCLKLAQVFDRGYGSIEQIYRWASTPKNKLSEERINDKFIQQIYRVKKNLGLRN